MARQEHSKENLLRDATGLADRIELRVAGCADNIVVGFRPGRAVSIYFGEQPAYHWNSDGQLRRAFVDDQLIKAEQGTLVSMQRIRKDGQVQLIRREITGDELGEFLAQLNRRLSELQTGLQSSNFQLVGQMSDEDRNVLSMVLKWLDKLPHPLRVAAAPNVS